MLFLDNAFGVAELQRSRDFFAHRHDVAVGVDPHAEQVKHAAHDGADGPHNRVQQQTNHPDRPGNTRCRRFRVRDCVGLGQYLGKDQHQKRHHQRRKCDAAFAKGPREHGGGQARWPGC